MELVIEKIIEMLENNKQLGCYSISEGLLNWLELGDIADFEDLTKEDFEYCKQDLGLNKKQVQFVYEIEPYVCSLTEKLAEMWEREEEENE